MVKIGPAGSDGLGNLEGVRRVSQMNMDCMEVAFTYGVHMTTEAAREVGAVAAEKGIMLSVHAPYYINLASDEAEKIRASKKRILDSCERAHALGARNVVFHAGFYQQKSARRTFMLVKEAVLQMQEYIRRMKWRVRLCPEITGRISQFGSLAELLRLRKETDCGITVDFSHLYARHQGDIDYSRLFKRLPKAFHAHFSGIEYGDKGEKRHVETRKPFFEPLARELVKRKRRITLIAESPRPYEDAAMMKKMLEELRGKKDTR